MRDIEVRLTWPEVLVAATVGVMRQIEALRQGRLDQHGADPENGWTFHIEGACGELAAARAANRYWPATVNTFKNGSDLLGGVDVRTRSRSDYELLVRQEDADHRPYVHVVGACPAYKVRGWLFGKDAKQPQWLQSHGGRPPAFFVPNEALRDMADLP